MADDLELNPGTGGGIVATDDCTGRHVQVVKLAYGADGDATHVAADAGGLLVNLGANNDVTGPLTDAELRATPVDVLGPLTDAELRATAVPVSGTFFQATQPVSGTVTANLSATDNDVLDAIAASVAGTLVVDGSGVTQPVSGTVTLAAGTNTNEVVGDIAHGTAVGGNPVQIGLEGRSSDMTAVDSGDVVRVLASLLGKQVVLPFAVPGASKSYASPAAVTDTSDDEAFAAIASTRTYITGVQVFNADATVGTEVVIKDGSTVLWRGYAAPVGGGCSAVFSPPLRGTANTAVNVANITTSAETYFNLQGYSATE